MKIEKKWQKQWEKEKDFEVRENTKSPKYYPLVEFPYPSGEGLHVGHIKSYTAMDIVARKRRAEGYSVLYPIGWDAFGLPTENYALKTGVSPEKVTKKNTDNFRKQLKSLGFSFDWSREINTTDPKYYKWTQWIFLKLFEKGLAYKKKMPINWCIDCKIGLANEEVVDGVCERCGGRVEMREKEQWMLKITEYADRLDKDLDAVNYLEKIKIQQRNWIGRSDGAEIEFEIQDTRYKIQTFTTRPDTLFGATYLVLAPEHKVISDLRLKISNWDEVVRYIEQAKHRADIERTAANKEKTGVELKGVRAINPANKEEIPIWVADYVLAHYGTGAIMAVPAHDERDFEFAMRYNLTIRQVISPQKNADLTQNLAEAYMDEGVLINSGKFNGLTNEEAKLKITEFVHGKKKVTYKLRDWVFSRQRYWGEPIPIIHCEKCGTVPVSEKDLPVELPKVKKYHPTDTGESPLAAISKWVNTKCPKCKGAAKRETDTMPNWAGSSWYYLRYCDPHNDQVLADKKKLKYWTPVDWYNGGMEHTTLHLLYSRFWHKFLFDIGAVPTVEPYAKRTSHGLILAENGEKMSKSKGNVVNPDTIVEIVGADSLRLYEMFMGPFSEAIAWNTQNIAGVRRFIERVYALARKTEDKKSEGKIISLIHQTIKKVGDDIEAMKFNTAISQMMIFLNALEKEKIISKDIYKIFVRLLAPFAPHATEEIWELLGGKNSIHKEPWPVYDEKKMTEAVVTIVVQVNGKVRGEFQTSRDEKEDVVKEKAQSLDKVQGWVQYQDIKKIIYIPGKLVNIVTGRR